MQKAIVIGGSSGIGKALVEILLKEGYKVGLSGIERDNLDALKEHYGEQLVIRYIDCGKAACTREIQDLVHLLGGLDSSSLVPV